MNLPGPLTVSFWGGVSGVIHPLEYERRQWNDELGEFEVVSCMRLPTVTDHFMRYNGRGRITVGPHMALRESGEAAMDDYDRQRVLVDVRKIKQTGQGMWIKGRLRRWWSLEDRRMVRFGHPSGDWRQVNHELVLVGVIIVYAPGYMLSPEPSGLP